MPVVGAMTFIIVILIGFALVVGVIIVVRTASRSSGARGTTRCASCGTGNPVHAKFCAHCGRQVT